MKYIVNTSNDPAYNVALEAYAFQKLTDIDEIFILWINEPAIIIGRHQNTIQEINKEFIDKNGIHVVRRLSGGGAVYHDLNNLNYTIISNNTQEGAFDFQTFSKPVIDTLAKLGVKAEFTGRNDLEINGQKFAGNAQAYYKGRMMHHGCLLFDVDMSVLGQALKVSKDKIESKGIKSVRARVTNIVDHLSDKITVQEFSDAILAQMKEEYPEMDEYVLSDAELSEIQAMRDNQFATWDWTYGKAPEYTIERGVRYDYKDVLAALKTVDTSQYFSRMTPEEITKAIVD
ncbi:TPA: lipoate--protein ligase [Streptococcus agalactiae]